MPIYEYLCADCGTKFEKLVRGSEASSQVECPSCGETQVSEQLSTFAAHASGSSRDALPSCGSGMCGNPDFCGRN
jgi:putative FmdB family regulatory protein